MAGVGPARPRVLCLDGGGIRGLSEILILKELMLQVRIQNNLDYTPEPNQCFDFICGTSTGGLLAVLLGRLGKTLNECEDLFRSFGSKIFSGGNVSKTLRMISTGSKHTSEGLSAVVRDQAGKETMHEVDRFAQGHVPVAVVAVSKTTRDDYLFRTYGTRASIEACPIVDACLATSAATTFFPSIEIDGVEYVDGAFRKNNPSSAALAELESAEWISPMQDAVSQVGCLVSVGTGRGTFGREASGTISKIIPKGLVSLKDAAKICIKIATDCHEAHLDVEKRFRRARLDECYHRFDVEIGLEAVMLNESDSKTLQHITSVTKGHLKSHQHEVERCARLISPRGTTNIENIAADQSPTFGMFSSLPECTEAFLGREEELLELRRSLDPSIPGRKSALLHGIGGSGKTQLALQHIQREARRYSAVIWINISTPAIAAGSVAETAFTMANSWPKDIPVLSSQRDIEILAHVKSRLRCTGHRNWLLVIDSADDPEHDDMAKYIPTCEFGSVLVTSTRVRHCNWFRPKAPIQLIGLDQQSSRTLLLRCAGRGEIDDDEILARVIVKELSGIPLAIEQAGGLIRNGEFTFSEFLSAYKQNYRSLMKLLPDEGLWSYEKNRVVLTILDMACRSLESEPEHVILLSFLGVLGSWQVPFLLLAKFRLFDFDSALPARSQSLESLSQILQEPHKLRLALHRLASFCMIRVKKEGNHLVSFMIHGILCQWSLDNLPNPQRQEIIIHSACGLAIAACQPKPQTAVLTQDRLNDNFEMVQQAYFPPLKQLMSLITEHVTESDLNPYTGRYRAPYAVIIRQAAWAHLAQGLSNEAKILFEQSLGFELSERVSERSSDESTLEILSGYSRACHRAGHLQPATESLESALRLSERVYGNDSEITLEIVSRLKQICERQEIMQQHGKAALLASATNSRRRASTKTCPGPSSCSQNDSHSESFNESHQWEDEDVHSERMDPLEDIKNACRAGDHGMVRLLLGLIDDVFHRELLMIAAYHSHRHIVELLLEKGTSFDHVGVHGHTVLAEAAENNSVCAVGLLIEMGADLEKKDQEGRTPLAIAAAGGSLSIAKLLIDSGAVVDSEDSQGRTPLGASAGQGHIAMVHLLLDQGADVYHLDKNNISAFQLAQGRPETIKCLAYRSRNVKGPFGKTALHFAARYGISGRERWLYMPQDFDVNVQDDHGNTFLHEACQLGRSEGVELLVKAGARCDIKNMAGRTPVDISLIWGKDGSLIALSFAKGYKASKLCWRDMSVAEVAISQPLRILSQRTQIASIEDLNICSIMYGTALQQAMRRGPDFVELLLRAGSHPDGVDNFNQTPLVMAIREDRIDITRVLVSHGADVDKQIGGYGSLWEYAVHHQRWRIAFILLESGAHINHKSIHIPQALKQAALWGEVQICKRLVDAGASWYQNYSGYTTLTRTPDYERVALLRYFTELAAIMSKATPDQISQG